MPIQIPETEVRDDVHFPNQNEKIDFWTLGWNLYSKQSWTLDFERCNANLVVAFLGHPFRGPEAIPSRAVTCWLPIRVYLFVFVFACLGPIFLIGGFHHQCCGQNQNWSKHELGCRANPGSSSLSWENGNPAVPDWDVSNFGLPRCQIFDCFSISPLSRLLFQIFAFKLGLLWRIIFTVTKSVFQKCLI